MTDFHPGFILIFGGMLAAVVPRRLRQAIMIGAPVWALIASLTMKAGTEWKYTFINNMQLIVLHADALSLLFAVFFSILTLLGCIYALHLHSRGETAAAMIYAGSSLSVVFAGDWLTLLFFWEVMAFSSVFLVWMRKTKRALAAGFRYIMIHFLGGNLLLAGIIFQINQGQFLVTALTGMNDWGYWLILAGISINAAIPPLHAWLTDAYPEATITGSIFLSSLTTKVAIYSLIRIFPGSRLLLWAGVIMAIYGILYAILENDIRRLLSYHIISQLGFMVAAVGIGTELALNGAAGLACSNIIYKSLLFMGAGAVIYVTGKSRLTDLGGLYRKMPWTTVFFGIGALSISGIPLFFGFITKPMITNAAALNRMPEVELLLYFASIGTFLSITLKLFYFMFFGKAQQLYVEKVPRNMGVAMAGGAFLCLLYGLFPALFYDRLPFAVYFEPYTLEHIVSMAQLVIAISAAFLLVLPKMATHNVINLDMDWFYRKPLAVLMRGIVGLVCRSRDIFSVFGNAQLKKVISFMANPLKFLPYTVEGKALLKYDEDEYRAPVGVIVLVSVIAFVAVVSYLWLKKYLGLC